MTRGWYFPLDPKCPAVKKFRKTLFEDPMTKHTGVGDEVFEGWERKHRLHCEQCQFYGAANVEIK